MFSTEDKMFSTEEKKMQNRDATCLTPDLNSTYSTQ